MQRIIELLKSAEEKTRIVTFGSSNTERPRNIGNAQNWVDWLDLGIRCHYGRGHTTINTGLSGETSREMLARFDSDVEFYKPHILFITCGGNDCNPAKDLSLEEYRNNLRAMIKRANALPSCITILQTYYSADLGGMNESTDTDYDNKTIANQFPIYMQAVREVAEETNCLLIDHLKRWEPLRLSDVVRYRTMMFDLMHMSSLGHTVFALDILRHFGAEIVAPWIETCKDAIAVQSWFDGHE